jgi:hypothetical protein
MKRTLIITMIVLAGALPASAQQNIGRILSIVGDSTSPPSPAAVSSYRK